MENMDFIAETTKIREILETNAAGHSLSYKDLTDLLIRVENLPENILRHTSEKANLISLISAFAASKARS